MTDHYHTFIITNIKQETPDVFTFFIEEKNGQQVHYKAGQFLTFLFPINGREVRRSYSLSSSPTSHEPLSFTVKRIPNGEVSRYLTSQHKTGDELHALLPAGRFTIADQANHYCFIAAGTGITPIYSLIKFLLQSKDDCRIFLLYQNHSEQTSIFRKELLLLQEAYPERLRLVELFSHPTEHSILPKRLNNTMLENIMRQNVQNTNTHFYTCGPKSFMLLVEVTLRWMGYQHIKKENFVIDAPPPPPLLQDTSPKQVELYLHNEKHSFTVQYPQNILAAALEQGIDMPYSCRGGRCSTCMAKCLEGKTVMSINEVLTDDEVADGWVLTCVGFAETDVVLRKSSK